PNPAPPARPIEFDRPLIDGAGVSGRFGVHGQRIVWWLGGYWRPGRRCEYDRDYEVIVRGIRRFGRADILCDSTLEVEADGSSSGRPPEVIEVKWFRTDVEVWPTVRVRKFVDQVERYWLLWQHLSRTESRARLVYMFGWTPPANARLMLAKAGYQFPTPWAPGEPMYEPIHEVAPLSGVVDRALPPSMLDGRAYWTRFIPRDFEFIHGVLDEAPCVRCDQRPALCGIDDGRVEIAGCRRTGEGEIECGQGDDVLAIRLTEASDVYVNMVNLKKWAAIYQDWCILGLVQGCDEWLSTLYDDIKCEGW
ncbi:MAG: hypothetical protein R3F65_32475, partial [bacterium]